MGNVTEREAAVAIRETNVRTAETKNAKRAETLDALENKLAAIEKELKEKAEKLENLKNMDVVKAAQDLANKLAEAESLLKDAADRVKAAEKREEAVAEREADVFNPDSLVGRLKKQIKELGDGYNKGHSDGYESGFLAARNKYYPEHDDDVLKSMTS